MGALLGYPPCCVARFVSLRSRDDGSLAGALLPPLGARTPFATAFTLPPFALVSHAPCEPTCAGTRVMVAAIVRSAPPHVRALYRGLATARWGVTSEGFLARETVGTDGPITVRIDVADPELDTRPWRGPEGTRLDLVTGGACWRIETVPGDELA
jgi:hypothetical protein